MSECSHEKKYCWCELDAACLATEQDLARAIETRENANAVSLRLEHERDRYKAALERIESELLDYQEQAQIARDALNWPADDDA